MKWREDFAPPGHIAAWRDYMQGGRDVSSRNRLVELNTGLVWSVVDGYASQTTPTSECEDLFQEGCIGLIEAVERFKIYPGGTFSGYAMITIRRHVGRYLQEHGERVRIPVGNRGLRKVLLEAEESFSHAYGHGPSVPELAAFMGIPFDRLERIRELSDYRTACSLEEVSCFDGGAYEKALVHEGPGPAERLESRASPFGVDMSAVWTAFGRLPPTSRMVVRLFAEGLSLEQIGTCLGLGRKNVWRIKKEAIAAVRRWVPLE